jgi:hypothetical protein
VNRRARAVASSRATPPAGGLTTGVKELAKRVGGLRTVMGVRPNPKPFPFVSQGSTAFNARALRAVGSHVDAMSKVATSRQAVVEAINKKFEALVEYGKLLVAIRASLATALTAAQQPPQTVAGLLNSLRQGFALGDQARELRAVIRR